MKHTKGPWGIEFGTQVYPMEGETHIANCSPEAGKEDSGTEEQRANAKLISAAPQMLDDLKLTDEMLGELRKDLAGTPADVVIGKWRAMLQRTIARAETK